MIRIFLMVALLFVLMAGKAIEKIDSLQNELERQIEKKDFYFKKKLDRIDSLKHELAVDTTVFDNQAKYEVCLKLYNEYESFIYDSAFRYAERLRIAAEQLNDPVKIFNSKIKLGFVLLSSGLFKEALDSLSGIYVENLSDSIRAGYFAVVARAYYDLADYEGEGYYAVVHRKRGNDYIQMACKIAHHGTLDYWLNESLHRMKTNDYKGAHESFAMLLSNYKLSDHQFAIVASSLGYLNTLMNDTTEAIAMLYRAAIADIKSSVKETVALRNLSGLLYKQGDVKTAYRYIKLALEDATFYNARHRKIEIAAILPIIEGEKLNAVERQKVLLLKYSALITLLSLLVIVFALIIFRQLRKLKHAKQIIQDTNNDLLEVNHRLLEANKIKEEYIGYFFNSNSEYIDKIEKFQRDVHRKLSTNQIDDIRSIIKNIDLKKEREDLYRNFDKIFLKLFPDFVEKFNLLFKEEDRIILKDNELLNTDLRIFALIRMGISDNEKIAKILEYSVNTIYTYKTKIKNKSIVSNDEFEQRIMEIKAL